MKQTIYWGVLCRACSEPVAFGSPSHQQFELETEYGRPGSICCEQGHNFFYFPRDFKFFSSAEVISDAVMQRNRDAHWAINPPAAAPTNYLSGKRWTPDKRQEAGAGDVAKPAKTAIARPDPRREAAQAAARERWTNWAIKKAPQPEALHPESDSAGDRGKPNCGPAIAEELHHHS